MSYKPLSEIFEQANTPEKLKQINPLAVNWLYYSFAEWEFFELPEGAPPFKQLHGEPDTAYEKLLSPKSLRMIANFQNKEINKMRREHLFIQMLESLYFKEAELLIAIKDKTVTDLYPHITREVVDACFPNLLVLPANKTL